MSQPILFAPVSGPGGSGEYYRCLALARAIVDRDARPIHFLIHRAAQVERDERFHYHELEASPTRATRDVLAIIERVRPALAVFDAAGRMAQYDAVKRIGGKLVWISNRPKKRRKGFRPRMLKRLDLHLVASPDETAPELGWWERVKWRHCGRPRIRFFSTIAPSVAMDAVQERCAQLGLRVGDYIVFVGGAGGHHHAGRPVPEWLLEAARRVQAETGRPCVVVLGPQYRGQVREDPQVHVIEHLSSPALAELLAGARVVVSGAGWMMSSQVLSAGLPAVFVPAGGADQPERIRRYQASGLAESAPLEVAAIAAAARRLDGDEARRQTLIRNIRDRGVRNDTGILADELLDLIDA